MVGPRCQPPSTDTVSHTALPSTRPANLILTRQEEKKNSEKLKKKKKEKEASHHDTISLPFDLSPPLRSLSRSPRLRSTTAHDIHRISPVLTQSQIHSKQQNIPINGGEGEGEVTCIIMMVLWGSTPQRSSPG